MQIGDFVDTVVVSEGGIALTKLCVILLLRTRAHVFLGDVGLFPVTQRYSFGCRHAYRAFHHNIEVVWNVASYVGWFLFVM